MWSPFPSQLLLSNSDFDCVIPTTPQKLQLRPHSNKSTFHQAKHPRLKALGSNLASLQASPFKGHFCLMSAINALPMVCIFSTPVMAATPSAPMLQFSKQFPSFPISQSYISTSLIVLSHYSLLIPHVQCPFISLWPGTLQVSSNSHTICKLLQNGINKTLFQAFIYFKQ